MSVLLLSDLFAQLDFNSFVVCYVQIFEQINMDGWKYLPDSSNWLATTDFAQSSFIMF